MNREDRLGSQPVEYVQAANTDGPQDEQALARARYEQSHPDKSHLRNQPTSQIPQLHTGLQDSMDLSHATTTIEGGESTYSYDSAQDLAAYFREINGRKFSSQASTYMLPADETEFWRLDKQHAAFLVALGNLYPCPDLVERVMARREGEVVQMIDLGCGTGTWALSMARRFPHAQVLGIDIAPVPLNPNQLTPNIRFEIEDINLGLPERAGRFDLVHMRCVGGGLPNYSLAITYAMQCLKPGGLLLVVDLDLQLCAEDKVSGQKMATPNQPDESWIQRVLYEFRWAYAANGTDILESEEMLDKGLWGRKLLDGCGSGGLFIPVGPWAKSTNPEESQRLGFAGVLMRQNLRTAIRSFQTLMKKHGVPQDTLDDWVKRCEEELDSLKVHQWIRLRMLWGLRNSTDAGTVLSPESTSTTQSGSLDLRPSTWRPHQQVHFYHTAEEAQVAWKKRQETLGELVEPRVLASA